VDTPGDNFDTRDGGDRHPQDRALRRHGFTPDDRERFEAGCRAHQDKLFGGRPAAPGAGGGKHAG
jgi:hypothetical protein